MIKKIENKSRKKYCDCRESRAKQQEENPVSMRNCVISRVADRTNEELTVLTHDVTVRTALRHSFTDPHKLDPLSGEHHNPCTSLANTGIPSLRPEDGFFPREPQQIPDSDGNGGRTRLCTPHCGAESSLFLYSVLQTLSSHHVIHRIAQAHGKGSLVLKSLSSPDAHGRSRRLTATDINSPECLTKCVNPDIQRRRKAFKG